MVKQQVNKNRQKEKYLPMFCFLLLSVAQDSTVSSYGIINE
jgi:hypothetical protein